MSSSGNIVAVSTSCPPDLPMLMLMLQVKRRVEAKNGLENYAFQVRNSLRDEKVSLVCGAALSELLGSLGRK